MRPNAYRTDRMRAAVMVNVSTGVDASTPLGAEIGISTHETACPRTDGTTD